MGGDGRCGWVWVGDWLVVLPQESTFLSNNSKKESSLEALSVHDGGS